MPKRTFFRLDEDKQERVIRSAINEFQASGFEKAKISIIAENAKVANGSIYQYFDDKKELFLYCVSWTIDYFMKKIDEQTPLREMDIFDYFMTGTRERMTLLKREPALVLFTQDLLSGKYAFFFDEVEDEFKRIGERYISKLIAAGKKKGTIRTDMDDNMLTLFFRGATLKVEEYIFTEALKLDFDFTDEQAEYFEELLRQLVALLKHGMGVR